MRTKTEVIYNGPIAGVSFGHFKFRPDRLRGRAIFLLAKPDNEYDPKAIEVLTVINTIAQRVGYIPRIHTWKIHAAWEKKYQLKAEIGKINLGAPAAEQAHIIVTTETRIKRPLNPPGTRRILL